MMLQLDPPMPVIINTAGGPLNAFAHVLLDYGFEHDLMWVCFMDDPRECWTVSNRHVRAQTNLTAGRA